MKIAIACLIVGVGCGGFSLFGYFDPHASYCDGMTNPCTPVVVSGTRYPKTAKFVRLHRGSGLARVLAGAAAAASFGAGYFASSAGAQRSQKIDEEAAAEEARQKQLDATTSDILTAKKSKKRRSPLI